MAASAIANIAVSRLPRRHQGPARAAASLAAVGVAVEAFAWMKRHAGHPAARVLARPGHELQRVLGTREPAAGSARGGPSRARPAARGGGRDPLLTRTETPPRPERNPR